MCSFVIIIMQRSIFFIEFAPVYPKSFLTKTVQTQLPNQTSKRGIRKQSDRLAYGFVCVYLVHEAGLKRVDCGVQRTAKVGVINHNFLLVLEIIVEIRTVAVMQG